MPGVDWETCMTLNGTWGYSEHDQGWKSDKTLIRNLVDIASKGGNYLLNIGPKGDGSLCPETLKAFTAIGAWMKVNGESIHGTTGQPVRRAAMGPRHPQGQRALPARLRVAERRRTHAAAQKPTRQGHLAGPTRRLRFPLALGRRPENHAAGQGSG